MKTNKSSRYNNYLSFIDLLFNLMLGFAAMFLLSLQMLSPIIKENKQSAQRDAVYIIRIEWQHDSQQDVDLWVQFDNNEEICSFRNKQTQTMNLDRDNLGTDTNRTNIDHITEEITSIREPQIGWYTVNIHWYSGRGNKTLPIVKWSLMKVKPSLQTIANGEATLEHVDQELTVIRFELDEKNEVVDKDPNSQVKFIYKTPPGPDGNSNAVGPGGR